MKKPPLQATFRRLGELPARFDISEPANLRGVDPQDPQSTIALAALVESACNDVKEGFGGNTPAHRQRLRRGMAVLKRLQYMHYGGDDFLPKVRRPPYSEWLQASARNYLANTRALHALVPAVSISVNDTEVQELTEHLEALRDYEKEQAALSEGLSCLISNVEDRLYTLLGRAYDLSVGTVNANSNLSANLKEFLKLFTKSSEEAQETRKDRERVDQDATDRTIEAVKRELTRAQKGQPQPAPPATPAPPAVDLDGLKAKSRRRQPKAEE